MPAMQRRNLLILAAVTVVIVVAAAVTSLTHAPKQGKDKPLLFPDLKDHINNTGELVIRGEGRRVNLLKKGDRWVVQQAGGYPARFEKIKRVLLGMTTLRVLEEKTSTPDLYPRIGVEDPDSEGAASHEVELKDSGGKVLASLIVGKDERGSSPMAKPALYVREPDKKQSLLVEGQLPVSSQITAWFNRELFSVEPDRIQSITIEHPGGKTVTVTREQSGDDFSVEPLLGDREPQSTVVLARMGTVLKDTFADNVASGFNFPDGAVTVTVRTFDGLVAEARCAEQDGRNYVAFHFSVDEAKLPEEEEDSGKDKSAAADNGPLGVREQVKHYNDKVSGWAYTLPGHRYDLLTRSLDDLTRPAKSEG